jgi:hypothetical protein
MGKVTLEWERIESSEGWYERAQVPGGWLMQARYPEEIQLVFVPDAEHAWGEEPEAVPTVAVEVPLAGRYVEGRRCACLACRIVAGEEHEAPDVRACAGWQGIDLARGLSSGEAFSAVVDRVAEEWPAHVTELVRRSEAGDKLARHELEQWLRTPAQV